MTGAPVFIMLERTSRSGTPKACVVYYGPATDPRAFRFSRDEPTEHQVRSRRAAESTSASRRRRLCTPWRPAEELFAQTQTSNEIGPAVLIADGSMHAHFAELRTLP